MGLKTGIQNLAPMPIFRILNANSMSRFTLRILSVSGRLEH